ncbi:MAG: energy-coupling factor transporter ATPase [Clostridiales bacterium]|nr:energy-coupling factor transporter ATPase [Clostridiales bacterium]
MAEPIIQMEHITFSYTTEEGVAPVVLDDVTLDIEKGSFVAVLGHNGSGKSTLAKHMNAILLPAGGKVYVSGVDTADEDRWLDIHRMVGMVFQNPDNQIVANVVEEDIAFAPENLGVPPAEIRQRVDDALAIVGMSDYARHAPHLLSGGQKQRVAIAGVIAMQPECIVLDEPTAMLDPIGREEVMETILRLNREQHTTVVLITHHMDEASQAQRLVVMDHGKIVADGAPRQVFSYVDKLKAIGLTVPDTVGLLYELNQAGLELPVDALSVEECAGAIYKLLTTRDKE